MRWRLVDTSLMMVASVLLLASGAAQAMGTLDQQQTQLNTNFQINTGPPGALSQSLAQTFTPGLTGGLNEVDLDLCEYGATAPLIVEITTTSGGAPTSTALASESVPRSSITTNCNNNALTPLWVAVNFASPAHVVAGTQYAIVAFTTDTSPYNWGAWSAPIYGGGGMFYSSASPPTSWASHSADMAFKTYVETAVGNRPPRHHRKHHRGHRGIPGRSHHRHHRRQTAPLHSRPSDAL